MPRARLVAALAVSVGLLGPAASAQAAGPFAAGATFLISGAPGGPGALPTPASRSVLQGDSSVSDDGRFVVFSSSSDGLSAEDDTRFEHVYRKDLLTGAIELVDRRSGVAGETSHADASSPSISDDGQRVAFISAGDLDDTVPADGRAHVYVRSFASTSTVLLDRASGSGGAVAALGATEATLSGNGAYVVFVTAASLAPEDTDSNQDVYRRGLGATKPTVLVNASDGSGAPGVTATQPSLSDDGDVVAFVTRDAGMAPGTDANTTSDVYVRTVSTQSTRLASAKSGTNVAGGSPSLYPSVSGDGTRVTFASLAADLGDGDTDGNFDVHQRVPATFTTKLISRADGLAGAKADAPATTPSSSDDGDAVAFASPAGNLGAPVSADTTHVFVRRVAAGTTALASRTDGDAGSPALGFSFAPAISGDGTRVAFTTQGAPELADLADPAVETVLARDLGSSPRRTLLVARPPGTAPFLNAGGSARLGGADRALSRDGRVVVFVSAAPGLPRGGPASGRQIYARDLLTDAVTLVSRGPDGTPADAESSDPSVSADGTRVAFTTKARLVDEDVGTEPSVYVRDLVGQTTTLVSRADGPAGAVADGYADTPAITATGTHVAFVTGAANLGDGDGDTDADVHVRDLAAARTTFVSRADGVAGAQSLGYVLGPQISADGSVVAFASSAENLGDGDTDTKLDIHVRDLTAGTTRLASRAPGGPQSDGEARAPSLSDDGNRVAFASTATNLVADAGSGLLGVYVRDLRADTLVLAARRSGAFGARPADEANTPALSGDGRTVAFVSSDLTPEDGVLKSLSVFLRDLQTHTTTLVSRADGAGGAPNAQEVQSPHLSADGGCLAFTALGDDLVAPSLAPAGDIESVYGRALRGTCPVPGAAPAPGPDGGPGAGPGAAPPLDVDRTAPVLRAVSLTRTRFAIGAARTAVAARATPRGTTLRVTPSEAVRLTVTVARVTSGRRVGRSCRRSTAALRRRPACRRTVKSGSFSRRLAARPARIAFSGRIGRHALARGRYTLTVAAADAAGNRAPPRTLALRIVRR